MDLKKINTQQKVPKQELLLLCETTCISGAASPIAAHTVPEMTLFIKCGSMWQALGITVAFVVSLQICAFTLLH